MMDTKEKYIAGLPSFFENPIDEKIPIQNGEEDTKKEKIPLSDGAQKKIYNVIRMRWRGITRKDLEATFALKDIKDIDRTCRKIAEKGWIELRKEYDKADAKWHPIL
jgi:hypothetical protein